MAWYAPWTWGRGSIPLAEAIPFADGLDRFGNAPDRLFRRMHGHQHRDLPEHKRERMLKIVFALYACYPLANRGLNIIRDFVVGEGLTYKAIDPDVQERLDAHWQDPINNWAIKQNHKALEIFMYGEQYWVPHVNEENGEVRLGYIDPIEVSAVLSAPENIEVAEWVILKSAHAYASHHFGHAASHSGGHGVHGHDARGFTDEQLDELREKGLALRVVHPNDDPADDDFGLLQGDVFYFKYNSCSSCVRGNSALLSVIDWIELHESFLMSMQEAAVLKNSMVWDVTVENAKDKQLKEFAKQFGRIKSGVTRFHSDKVKVENISPDLGTSELAEHSAVILRHIAAGLGIPPHWLSQPEGANRAVALEMGQPTTKSLRSKQRLFRDMVAHVFDFVIDQAIKAGRLDEDVDRSFKIITPPIWAVDVQQIAASLQSMAQALMLAQQNNWITAEAARASFLFTADQMGFDTSAFDNASRGREDDGEPDEATGGLGPFAADRMASLMADALSPNNVAANALGANGNGS